MACIKIELEQVGLKTSRVSKKLEELDARLKSSSDDLQKQLNTLLSAFRESQNLIKETLILKCLEFPEMSARFRTIHAAGPDTFGWIFSDPEMLLRKEPRLETSFTEWLRSGSGIFHIAGKAGSGKSTLMKFLCEHDDTGEHLQEWADSESKELIFCKFFFWRITSIAEQKTLKGLIRGLLHSVLLQVPSLAQRLFPKQWGPRKGTHQGRIGVELGDGEISTAFENLMHDATIFDEFRICFFIDGLDEFEQDINLQSETHYTLATKLQNWAINSGGQVKMCVSSRPLREFTGTFRAAQQITLQKLTEDDIRTLVSNRLEQNARFADLKQQSEDNEARCHALADKIIEDAKGVFLWVVLILNQLEQALASGDPIEMLETIVAKAHKDLKPFFKSILESIPQRYREGSYYLLAAVMRISGALVSESKGLPELRTQERDIMQVLQREEHITLDNCALVFDTADKGKLLEFDETLANSNRNVQQDEDLVQEEKDRLLTRCRGLVEADMDFNLRFTHRSIPESLQDLFSGEVLEHRVLDEKVAEMLTWIVLTDVRQRWPAEWREQKDQENPQSPVLLRLIYVCARLRACAMPLSEFEKTFQLLYNIHQCLLLAQFGTPTPSDVEWKSQIWADIRVATNFGIPNMLRLCPILNLHEFAGWVIESKLSPAKNKNELLALLSQLVTVAAADFKLVSSESIKLMTNKVLECGLVLESSDTTELTRDPDEKQRHQPWHEFLAREVFFRATHLLWCGSLGYPYEDDPEVFNWRGLETLLRFGADPEVCFRENEANEGILLGTLSQTLYTISAGDFKTKETPKFVPLPHSPISLTDFIRFHNPPNMDELFRLVEENIAKKNLSR